MRKVLPLFSLATFLLITSSHLNAQRDRFAYAITDLSKEGAGWNALRRLDLQTGEYSELLLNGTELELPIYDATTRKQLTIKPDAKYGNIFQAPFNTGVAAAAYDRKHNRLYYTPMFIDQLRYIDLKNMKVYYISDQPFTNAGNMQTDQGKIITRMVIAPDGYGYAISNDGNTFIRFSTGKKTTIEQLGALVDDPSNSSVSIHNSCSSAGGDMIADDQGNFYILTARNQVFKVNTETRVATHLGSIKNLPGNFTVNGAVVNDEGSLLVSSAVDGSAYYVINPKDWTASIYKTASGVYRSSDLANSNYLSSKKWGPIRPEIRDVELIKSNLSGKEEIYSRLITVYPNPVTSNNVTIQFNKVPNGDYIIDLIDALGRSVMKKRVTVTDKDQVQSLSIKSTDARGSYLVKVFDASARSVFTQKVLVQ